MIIEPIKNIKSGRSDLRKFCITVGIVLGLLSPVIIVLLIIGTLIVVVGGSAAAPFIYALF